MALLEDFNEAVSKSKDLSKRPSNEELLEMYGLYKQATDGNVASDRPGGFDFKAIAKYDAWSAKKGLSKEQAMTNYLEFMKKLKESYS